LAKEKMPRRTGARAPSAEKAEYESLQLEELRARANLSMDRLAKAMGFKGQSSIQRYLSSDYHLGFRPEMLNKFKKALLGKGNPPITEADFALMENTQRLREVRDKLRFSNIQDIIAADQAGKVRAVLPLPEGSVILEAPDSLSAKSIEFLKAWLDIVASAIESQIDDAKRPKK
jgi:hypothetical protein